MKGLLGVVVFLFLFITLSLGSRESLTSIGSKRKVPRGPNNMTSPPTPVTPPAFTKDIEIKRWVITQPPTPPASVANFEMKRKVPRGPDNRTSPPTPVTPPAF